MAAKQRESNIELFRIVLMLMIIAHHYVGAFVGRVSGNGQVVLEQLGNEADVQAWNQNAGGILGCNTSGQLKLVLTNCYNTGTIESAREAGGISGWLGDHAELTNCYNMGDVQGEGSESFARGNDIHVTNCFDPVSDWAGTTLLTPIEDFTNGTVYNKLSEAAPGIWYLSAEVNAYPVLYNTGITTGISTVDHSAGIMRNEMYDLQGRRVARSAQWDACPSKNAQLKKGLYIVDGKKVVVK